MECHECCDGNSQLSWMKQTPIEFVLQNMLRMTNTLINLLVYPQMLGFAPLTSLRELIDKAGMELTACGYPDQYISLFRHEGFNSSTPSTSAGKKSTNSSLSMNNSVSTNYSASTSQTVGQQTQRNSHQSTNATYNTAQRKTVPSNYGTSSGGRSHSNSHRGQSSGSGHSHSNSHRGQSSGDGHSHSNNHRGQSLGELSSLQRVSVEHSSVGTEGVGNSTKKSTPRKPLRRTVKNSPNRSLSRQVVQPKKLHDCCEVRTCI